VNLDANTMIESSVYRLFIDVHCAGKQLCEHVKSLLF